MPDDPTVTELLRLVREARAECSRLAATHVDRGIYDAHREAEAAQLMSAEQRLAREIQGLRGDVDRIEVRMRDDQRRTETARRLAWTSLGAPVVVALMTWLLLANIGGAG